jgi:hypothetical protein
MKPRFNKYIILNSLIFLLLIPVSWSCQKVINVDLNSAALKLVIAANVTDQPGPYSVTLSQTVNFTQDNNFPPVRGARVLITDNAGNIDTLTEFLPGVYQTSALQGVPGRTYTLTVSTGGETYTGSSTMPPPVSIDTLTIRNGFNGKNKIVTLYFRDPAGIDNYYHVVEKVNNIIPVDGKIVLPTLGSVHSDRLSDGTEIEYSPGGDNQPDLVAGDTVSAYLQCIDKNVYNYYRTAQQNGSTSTTLSNPVTNLSNGALGYFSAYSVGMKRIIVK